MNKKILIGSIIAVVILVLVSFTGVVGYQTTKSSTIAIASPLFSVRSKRAIDEESKDITCDYVGKGEKSILSIPHRDNRIEMVQKVLDIISKMSDRELSRLIELAKNKLHYIKRFSENDKDKIVNVFHHIIDDSQVVPNNDNALNVNSPLFIGLTVKGNWKVGCIILLALGFLSVNPVLLLALLSSFTIQLGFGNILLRIEIIALVISLYIWAQIFPPTVLPPTCNCFP